MSEMWLVELEDGPQIGPNTVKLFTKESYAYDWVEKQFAPENEYELSPYEWGDTYGGQAYFDNDEPLAYVRRVEVTE